MKIWMQSGMQINVHEIYGSNRSFIRTKMESISLNTKELDKTLADKRTKV
jgi:hypothetical protein